MILSIIFFVITFVLANTIQSFVFPVFLDMTAPNFLPIFIVVLCLHQRSAAALLLAFVLGIVSDGIGGIHIGPQAGAALISCFSLHILLNHVYSNRMSSIIVFTAISMIIHTLSSSTIVWTFIESSELGLWKAFPTLNEFLFSLFWTLVFAIPTVKVCNYIIDRSSSQYKSLIGS